MLRVFGHPVVTCYDVLRHVTTCWVLLAQICKWSDFSCNICGCCSRLARFMQQCCAQACALVRFSTRNMCDTLQQGGQTRTACCAQQCCDLLRLNVAIVWPELANAGPTLLGYVALRCCYRLAGT